MENINELNNLKEISNEDEKRHLNEDGVIICEPLEFEMEQIGEEDSLVEKQEKDDETQQNIALETQIESPEEIVLGEDNKENFELNDCFCNDVSIDEILVDYNGEIENFQREERLKMAKSRFDSIRCDRKVSVYAKTNSAGYIIELASDIFLNDFENWTKIDEGDGDKFVHPQISYFEDGLCDEQGNYNHKL